ncbi:MAG: hypothetical protein JW995_04095 [Melioribacteraceae bacterium]|nr:hypothetical protein [Melioribacteraceae bacterium]
MKKLILVTLFAIATLTFAKPAHFSSGVSIGFFITSLEPYGEWIEIERDLIVWRPVHISGSWRPYCDGRWLWTNDGWYWDSYEPFGWATYHYGRWYLDDYYGWVWFPDYEWAPSWVEWRYNDRYLGWAPLPPYASFHIDFGIHFSIGWHSHHSYWNFVPYNRFVNRNVNYYIIDNSTNINVYNNTKYRTNYRYRDGRIFNGGVDRNYVEKKSGYRIAQRSINTTDNFDSYRSRSNDDRSVTVYRPGTAQVEKSKSIDRSKIVKSERKISVDADKVRTRRSSENTTARNETVKRGESGRDQKDVRTNVREKSDRSIEKNQKSENRIQKADNRNKAGRSGSVKKSKAGKSDQAFNRSNISKQSPKASLKKNSYKKENSKSVNPKKSAGRSKNSYSKSGTKTIRDKSKTSDRQTKRSNTKSTGERSRSKK